ncbi:MAG TPA: serine kinase [Deltaproteobacteria bacterium]|nr:serine kinase [Deltaproteobacteria bacterium]HIJ41165.1 serine kinase [Deltaproteobacteria bacterium]
MTLADIARELELVARTGSDRMHVQVKRGYVSDLMSDVIGNARDGALWVTMQTHQNIVAVAVMKSLACIILVNEREPEEATVKKAELEGIPILISKMPAFELVGRLFGMGISGT